MPNTTGQIQTVLGFDFGVKRIGVAVGQTITATASPLCILRANNGAPAWDDVAKLISQWQPQALIVGIPTHADESPLKTTQAAKRFGNRLHGRFHLPVYWIDERLSSHAAEHWQQGDLYSVEQLDSLAAKVILETWLNQYRAQMID